MVTYNYNEKKFGHSRPQLTLIWSYEITINKDLITCSQHSLNVAAPQTHLQKTESTVNKNLANGQIGKTHQQLWPPPILLK